MGNAITSNSSPESNCGHYEKTALSERIGLWFAFIDMVECCLADS